MVEYRPFGRTGVQVSNLTLGAMNFGQRGNPDHDDSIRIIHRALDEGLNIIDTADGFDPTTPANAGKLEAVEQLTALAEQAGLSLIHLALAFVLQHPAITSPIIGPRTLEQLESQLGATKVTLTPDVLDRIDEIVPPGVTLNPADAGYQPPPIADPARRRR